MEIIVQFVQTRTDKKSEELVREKLASLATRYEGMTRADVFFREDPADDAREYVCEIRCSVPGPRLFASARADRYEKAVAEAIGNMERQLHRRKEGLEAR